MIDPGSTCTIINTPAYLALVNFGQNCVYKIQTVIRKHILAHQSECLVTELSNLVLKLTINTQSLMNCLSLKNRDRT